MVLGAAGAAEREVGVWGSATVAVANNTHAKIAIDTFSFIGSSHMAAWTAATPWSAPTDALVRCDLSTKGGGKARGKCFFLLSIKDPLQSKKLYDAVL
jgi:hypothetical protein